MQKYLNLKLSCLTILSALSLIACNSGSAQHNNTQSTKPQLKAQSISDPTILLDLANVSSENSGVPIVQEGGSSCINSDNMEFSTSAPERHQRIEILGSASSQFSSLDASASLGIEAALFNLALDTSFRDETAIAQNDIVINYTEDVSMPLTANAKAEFKPIGHGHKILAESVLNDPNMFDSKLNQIIKSTNFLSTCGDGYVSKLEVGNRINGKLTLHFNDSTAATKFKLALDTSYKSVTSVNLKAALDITTKNTNSTFSVFADIQSSGGSRYKGSLSDCSNSTNITACIDAFNRGMENMSDELDSELKSAQGTQMSYSTMREKIKSFKVLPSINGKSSMGFNSYPNLSKGAIQFTPEDKKNQNKISTAIQHMDILRNQMELISRVNGDIEVTNIENNIPVKKTISRSTIVKDNKAFKDYSSQLLGKEGANLKELLNSCFVANTTKCPNEVKSNQSVINEINELYTKYSGYSSSGIRYYLNDPNGKPLFYLSPIKESGGITEFMPVLLNNIFPLIYKTSFYMRLNIKSPGKYIQNEINNITSFILDKNNKSLKIEFMKNGQPSWIDKSGCSSFDSEAINCPSMEDLWLGQFIKTEDTMSQAMEKKKVYPIDDSKDHYFQKPLEKTPPHISSNVLLEGMVWSYPGGVLTINNKEIKDSNKDSRVTFGSEIKNPMLFVLTEQRYIKPLEGLGSYYQLGHVYVQSSDSYSLESGNLDTAQHLATIVIGLDEQYNDTKEPRWAFRIHNGNLVFIDSWSESPPFSGITSDYWDEGVYQELIKVNPFRLTLDWTKMKQESREIIGKKDYINKDFIIYGPMNKTELDQKINDTLKEEPEFDYWKNSMSITINKDIAKHRLQSFTWHNESSVTVTLKPMNGGSTSTRKLYRGGIYSYDGDKIKMDNWEDWEKNKNINPFAPLDKYQTVWIGWDKAIGCPGDSNLRDTIYNNMGTDREEMRQYLKANAWCEETHNGTNAGQVTYHLGKETTMPVTLLLNHWGWKDINSGWGNYQDHSLSRF